MKTFFYLAVLVGTSMCLNFCVQKKEEKPASDKSAAMKATFIVLNACYNTGNTEAVDTILSANSIEHPVDTTMTMPKGPGGLKQFIAMMRRGSPDLKTEIRMMAADGDLLWVYGMMSGTNTGDLMRRPATNKRWSSPYVDIVRFNSEIKIIEHWGVYDQFKMMRDLGTIPL